jgi:hypothetical protein
VSFYSVNNFSVLLNPTQTSYKQRASSRLFSTILSVHIFPLIILLATSLLPLYMFAILSCNYLLTSYAAGAVSLGYNDYPEYTPPTVNDRNTMSQLATLFFITGIWPLIYIQAYIPALFVMNLFILFYSVIAAATYLHFQDQPSLPPSPLNDIKTFFKATIFNKTLSLIEMNKFISENDRIKNPTLVPDYREALEAEEFEEDHETDLLLGKNQIRSASAPIPPHSKKD